MEQEYYEDSEAADLPIYSGKHINVNGLQMNIANYNEPNSKNSRFWSQFEKSGTIVDYLTYSACTKEV